MPRIRKCVRQPNPTHRDTFQNYLRKSDKLSTNYEEIIKIHEQNQHRILAKMTQETNADEIESIFQATYTTFPKCSACDRMRFHRYRIHSGRNICSLSVSELIKWMSSAELCSACIRVLVAAKRFITLLISRFIFAAVVFPAI